MNTNLGSPRTLSSTSNLNRTPFTLLPSAGMLTVRVAGKWPLASALTVTLPVGIFVKVYFPRLSVTAV